MKFIIFLTIIVGCKAQVKEAETSKPESFRSKDKGQILAVSLSSDSNEDHQNYCVLWSSHENNANSSKLLTTSGGISKGQIRKAFRSVLSSIGAITIGGGLGWVLLPSDPITDLVVVSVAGATGGAFLVADHIRARKKTKLLISEKVTEISDKEMGKIVQKISAKKSKAPGTCDHLLEIVQ